MYIMFDVVIYCDYLYIFEKVKSTTLYDSLFLCTTVNDHCVCLKNVY